MATLLGDGRKSVHDHFDRLRERWDEHYDPRNPYSYSFLVRRRKTADLLGDLSGKRLLDLGCGSGALLELIGRQGVEYHGIDLSEGMIQTASRRIHQMWLEDRCFARVGDVSSLPYPDAHFDAVVGLGLLEYLDDGREILREALRVAKPGAVLIFNIPRRDCLDDLLVRLWAPLRALARRLTGKRADIRRGRYTKKQFRDLFTDLGCRIVAEDSYNKLILPYPMTRLFPGVAFRWASWADRRPGMEFLATGYLLAVRKDDG